MILSVNPLLAVILVALALFFVYVIIVFGVCVAINRIYFHHRFTYGLIKPPDLASFPDLKRTPFAFFLKQNKLRGYYYFYREDFSQIVILAHGFGSNHLNYLPQIAFLAACGYVVFTYDTLGTCMSAGKGLKGDISFVEALRACLAYVTEKYPAAAVTLYGHSMGAFAVCSVADRKKVKKVIAVSAYDTSENIISLNFQKKMGKKLFLLKPMYRLLNRFIFGRDASLSALKGLQNTTAKCLLIHGTDDPTVPFKIWEKNKITNANVRFWGIPDKGHYPLLSAGALFYRDLIDAKKNHLLREYKKKVPAAVREQFNAEIDQKRRFQFDGDVMLAIKKFLEAV